MSVAELALRVQCSRQFVYALEDGTLNKVPGLLLAERIEAVTGIPRGDWDLLVKVNHHRPIRMKRRSVG